MRNDYYFDDLDIENFFLDDQREPGIVPNRPGIVDTRPEKDRQKTATRVDPLIGPVQFNKDGKLRDKLKAFVQSDKGKKILKIGGLVAGATLAIAFGPQLIAAIGPVMPAMKTALTKQGIKAKGPGEIIKKFADTQLKMADGDKKDPKKVITAILGFFKAAKDRRAAGTASPLDELVLKTADTTIQKISDGTLSVDQAVEGDLPGAAISGTKEKTQLPGQDSTTTTSTEKKSGIDMKIILIALVAVFFLTKKG
jgi:hypothetical protein